MCFFFLSDFLSICFEVYKIIVLRNKSFNDILINNWINVIDFIFQIAHLKKRSLIFRRQQHWRIAIRCYMYNPNRCNKTTGHCFAWSGSDFGSFSEYEMEVYQQPISMLQVTMFTFLDLSIFNFIQKSKLICLV